MFFNKITTKLYNLFDAYILYFYKRVIFKINKVEYDGFPVIWGIPSIQSRGRISIGKEVIITSRLTMNPTGGNNKTRIFTAPNSTLIIGDRVQMSNITFHVKLNVQIDSDVMLGGGVQIFDSDFHSLDYTTRISGNDDKFIKKKVHIKRGVFIGANAIILKGVTIGEKSIVAAGSIVTKSIPNNEIWGGNPAKKIRDVVTTAS